MTKLPRFLSTTEGKFVAAVVAIIVIMFAYYFMSAPLASENAIQNITITAEDHIRGSTTGAVTIVEFGDFQCPACGAYEPLVRQIVAQNATTTKFVFKQFPLMQIHRNSLLSAEATEAAGLQGKFWEMHDMLYDHQTDWSESLDARTIILGYAKTLGLDVKKFTADLSNSSLQDKILAEYKEGEKLGVQGTPTFFINGKKIASNPQSVEAFNALIKDALRQVKAQ